MNNYFSHDSNARNDVKLIQVRMSKLGASGYGIYWMIIERLREEPNYTSIKDYNAIAFDLRVDTSDVKSVIEDFGLFVFTDDGKYFYSESLINRMAIKDAKQSKLSEAGKKGAKKRWGNDKDSHPIATPSKNDSKKRKVKVSKEKVNKENISKDDAVVTNTSSNNRDSGLNETKNPHQQLFDFYTENFPSMSTFVIQSIEYDANDYGDELVLYAMQKAVLKNVSNYKYVQGILNGWDKDGIKTVTQAKQQETQFKAKTAVKGNNDDDPRNKGLAPDDPNYRPGRGNYTNAELKANHDRLGW